MNAVMFQVKERTRSNVTAPMIVWAIAMAVVLFMLEARYGERSSVVWAGLGATALLGAYLGWRRRIAATLVAPIVSWLVAWPPLAVAAVLHYGFFKGLFAGLFWITIGWALIATIELSVLLFFATVIKRLRGFSALQDPGVIVFGPDGSQL